MNTIKSENVKLINERDWSELVSAVYGRPYRFQQQEGCRDLGTYYRFTAPPPYTDDEYMNDEVQESLHSEKKGVKFKVWLGRNVAETFAKKSTMDIWWKRVFYPDVNAVVNDLYKMGWIEPGNYIICIDW